MSRAPRAAALAALLIAGAAVALLASGERPAAAQLVEEERGAAPAALLRQSAAAAAAASRGCLTCHAGIEKMHASSAVQLGCTDCHGGDPAPARPDGSARGDAGYDDAMRAAHVQPRRPELWRRADGSYSSANPVRSYTLLNEESLEFVRFVNPGDLRVAPIACGPCHPKETAAVPKSPMTTSSIFWAAAAYANGIVSRKGAFLGESYGPDGEAQSITADPPPDAAARARGALPQLFPLPRWEIVQPGEYFRAFERGGLLQPSAFPEIGNPSPFDEPGRPDIRLSNRGRGTGLRISPALINLHKTRLNDPHLSFLGTNDHPGDFRSSGCTACHVVYANDREPLHSGPFAEAGHLGLAAGGDPTIPRGESGHPIRHRLTRAVPTSQCMSCHMHQPNAFVNTYLGYTMWDYETDGEHLWPAEQRYPTEAEERARARRQPRGGGRARALERPGVPGPGLRAEPEARSTRSSPTTTATAGSSARSTSATGRATCSTRPARSCRSTTRSASRRRSTSRTSTSRGACTAPTATSPRTSTATASSTASTATRSRSSAATATATPRR